MQLEDLTRQSFLGHSFEETRKVTNIGILGLGGGGSHIGQQLAHLGFLQYTLVDPQLIEASNLNRLVGGTALDVAMNMPKVLIAERTIRSVRPNASVQSLQKDWHEVLDQLKTCDVIFGCLDSFVERDLLETFCRRYRILLFDIGMVVKATEDDHWIVGQVISSLPGLPCMKCMGFINEDNLRREAEKYCDAGIEPQVVWANGVLASSAVGVFLSAISDWGKLGVHATYIEYDGNRHALTESNISKALSRHQCQHYPPDEVGDVNFG